MARKEPEPTNTGGLDYRNVHVDLLSGDITQVQSDALITLINSERMWFGGVDGAIMRNVGADFHQAASSYLDSHPKATDGSVIFVDGSTIQGDRNFRNVIFVIDDLSISLERLVEAGLIEALNRNLSVVTMPLMRSGVMAGVVEKTPEQVADGMMLGIKGAADAIPNSPLAAKIVAYPYMDGARRSVLQASGERIFSAE
jgi:hypothetical protein